MSPTDNNKQIKDYSFNNGAICLSFKNGDTVRLPLIDILQSRAGADVIAKTMVNIEEWGISINIPQIDINVDAIRLLSDKEGYIKIKIEEAKSEAKKVGAKIQFIREERKISKQTVASFIDRSYQHISKIEAGKADLTYQDLLQIQAVLGYSEEEFLAFELPSKTEETSLKEEDPELEK